QYARDCLPVVRDESDGAALADGVQRASYTSHDGFLVRSWNSPTNLCKEPMARLMFHDVALRTDYVIWFDDDSYVEQGWWQALCPLLDRDIQYIGQEWWVDYLPGQEKMIQAQPWHRGKPFRRRDDRPGVWFMTGGFIAVRTECLRNTNFPD